MRVPTISLYNTSTSQLNTTAGALKEANTAISTQKRINCLADDPVGVSQTLGLTQAVQGLEQMDANIETGFTWINGIETALQSAQDLLLDTKLLCAQLVNASANASQRADAVETVDAMIDQIFALGNTQINGAYIFAGTDNDAPAFSRDADSPSGVAYEGSDTPFSLQINATSVLAVGRVGEAVFTEERIAVDVTNNTIIFQEDTGMGEEGIKTVMAVIPDGMYTPGELAAAVGDAMTAASLSSGYGIGYQAAYDDDTGQYAIRDDGKSEGYFGFDLLWESGPGTEVDGLDTVDAGMLGPDLGFTADTACHPPTSTAPVTLKSFDDTNNLIDFTEDIGTGPSAQLTAAIPQGEYSDMAELSLAVEEALEAASINNTDYAVSYDEASGTFTIEDEGGTLTGFSLLWNSGTHAAASAATALGFNPGADDTGAVSYGSDSAVVLFTVTPGENDTIDFKEILPDSSGDVSELTAVIPPGDYTDAASLAAAVEDAMEDASEAAGNRVDYAVFYNEDTHSFTIREDGETGLKLERLDLLWDSGSHASASAGPLLGFDTGDVAGQAALGEETVYGIFETLSALKGYLESDDVAGIERSMTRLDTHYDSITSVIADTGMKYNRLESTQTINSDIQLVLTERRSMIEDADMVTAIMELEAIQTAYEASLSATAKILNVSLADYL
ncbi:MAG: flagellar hook-associated protein FlgL [Desulfobacter sp.]|nr:MAG: flagellar hook-associated protein FlgL [Desulfobacter sp.]